MTQSLVNQRNIHHQMTTSERLVPVRVWGGLRNDGSRSPGGTRLGRYSVASKSQIKQPGDARRPAIGWSRLFFDGARLGLYVSSVSNFPKQTKKSHPQNNIRVLSAWPAICHCLRSDGNLKTDGLICITSPPGGRGAAKRWGPPTPSSSSTCEVSVVNGGGDLLTQ